MSDLANDIVAAKRAMNEFYSIKARPSALPPASVEELCVLAAELKRRGVPFPPSYRAFLTGCNGIRHFDRNLDLLPAATVMQPADQTLESDFPALAKFVIASGNRPAFIAFDPRTASAAGEMEVVWVTDEGEQDRYPNFSEFLSDYRDTLQDHVKRELADRKGLRR